MDERMACKANQLHDAILEYSYHIIVEERFLQIDRFIADQLSDQLLPKYRELL